MTQFEKNMEGIFNLPETKKDTEVVIAKKVEPSKEESEADIDYKYARENLYTIIEKGQESLNTLVDVAQQSQHPRAFEVVSQLVKTLSDTNKDLLELQRKIKVINKDIQEGPKTVNNSLYVGNTADLQKFINKRKESE
jgi:hypothetical protein|tara:strand:- start:783 stop:1196 length:414 start_codon:yes stop_codon:yes gene_type:complete